jgi:selenide,water dikinase
VLYNEVVRHIDADGVVLESGHKFACNVPVWATGAEPQELTIESDLDILKGYFRVNDYLQSTSHPNIFAGGDCVSIESYAQEANFPPKAGVYAIREGPVIAQNVVNMIRRQALVPYEP